MQALDGGAHLKIGSRVPIPAGSYRAGTSTGVQTQFSYYDVGLNIDATISTEGSSVNLRSHVEQTSLVPTDDKAEGPPVVRQSTFEDSSRVTPAKTAVIGSFDVPGTNRHVELQVLLEESR
jgi:type II secretory pathway component GspD/PulD (secretin)